MVFLSFHGPDLLAASLIKEELEREDVRALCYEPDNRWPDGPFETLPQIVEECHCVVYAGNRGIGSRFGKFEHRIAAEFALPVICATSIAQVRRTLPVIRKAAAVRPRLWTFPFE